MARLLTQPRHRYTVYYEKKGWRKKYEGEKKRECKRRSKHWNDSQTNHHRWEYSTKIILPSPISFVWWPTPWNYHFNSFSLLDQNAMIYVLQGTFISATLSLQLHTYSQIVQNPKTLQKKEQWPGWCFLCITETTNTQLYQLKENHTSNLQILTSTMN